MAHLGHDFDMTMKARVKWNEGMSFIAEAGSGHAVVLDGSPDHGGRNLGPRPMEMVLLGLGGCSAFDVVLILNKLKQKFDDCFVEIEATRKDQVPAVFETIKLMFVVVGEELVEKHVKRAVDLSMEKYCSVSEMLKSTVNIEFGYKILKSMD